MSKIAVILLFSALYVSGAVPHQVVISTADSSMVPVNNTDSSAVSPLGGLLFSVDSVPGTLSATPANADSLDRSVLTQSGGGLTQPQAFPRASTRKIPLIKRQFNYKQQVILALGMMAFVAIFMTTSQTWNPK